VSIKRDSISVGIAVGAAGAAFGAVAVSSHFSILQTCTLSLFLFSGASQFALATIMGSGGNPWGAIATGAFLGTRNGLYGIRMAGLLQNHGWRRIVAAQITIDESTGMAIAQDNPEDAKLAFWFTGFGVYIFWNLFTLLGALGAKEIGNASAWGLDVASPSIFVAVLWPRLREIKPKITAVVAIAWALSITHFVPVGVPILTTVLIAVFAGWNA
jgi:predicted branched-subunit amino acid permease